MVYYAQKRSVSYETNEGGVFLIPHDQVNVLLQLLMSCPLFQNMERDDLASRLESCDGIKLLSFSVGEEISLCNHEGERSLLILVSGNAMAYSGDEKRSVILRPIPPGTAFGVSVLFSEEPPVSIIRAQNTATVLYISSKTVEAMLTESPVFCKNYIGFLSDRIRFLNRRIACYTAGSAERKLALYLADLPISKDGIVSLPLSLSALSDHLSIGRASLYRAFDALRERGLIERNDKTVRISDRNALLSFEEEHDELHPTNKK